MIKRVWLPIVMLFGTKEYDVQDVTEIRVPAIYLFNNSKLTFKNVSNSHTLILRVSRTIYAGKHTEVNFVHSRI